MMRALGLAGFAVLAACQGQPAEQNAVAAAPTATPSASVSPVETPAAQTVACTADETPIFSCTFADRKRVAVCGTAPGKAEYRFGGDAPELTLQGGERAYAMYSGGGEQQLAFANGDTRYIVFSRVVRTRFDGNGNEPAISDGIVVERGGKFMGIRVCEGPEPQSVDVYAAEAHLPEATLPEDAFLFTEETMRADPHGNE
jgi:hypothetical protein